MTQTLLSIPFKLRFEGKDADNHEVSSYLGTKAIHGFTRSTQIATQAYINHDPVSRATALHDGKLYFTGAKSGSLIFDFRLDVFQKKSDVTLNRDTFYDFLSTVFHKATGRIYAPKSAYVKRLEDNTEDDLIDQTVEQVEESLKEAHSAIGSSISGMSFERPRSGTQTYFDAETKSYIQASIVADEPQMWDAHVTRFNSITGNGRAYVSSVNRIVPFRLDTDFPEGKRGFITWSLHGSNIHRSKNLRLDALETTSAAGTIKRLTLIDCARTGND